MPFLKKKKKKKITKMNFIFGPRPSFHVPSVKCQSLLGKALQEHFSKPEQVASVFSSSPSLQNSSAGANFLTNFEINETITTIFEIIFTPEDCFSVQLAPQLEMKSHHDDGAEEAKSPSVLCFLKHLLSNTKYLEASLRSLQLNSIPITAEDFKFITSRVKRLTKFSLLSMAGLSVDLVKSILENLSKELVHLSFAFCGFIDAASAFEELGRCKKLESFALTSCPIRDDAMYFLPHLQHSLRALCLRSCRDITPAGFSHLSSLCNLTNLDLSWTLFSDENFLQISASYDQLEALNLENCREISSAGMTNFQNLNQSLRVLNLNYTMVDTQGIVHAFHLKHANIVELQLAGTLVSDDAIQVISVSLRHSLRKLNLSKLQITNAGLEYLKGLERLERLDISLCKNLDVKTIHGVVCSQRKSLKKFSGLGCVALSSYCHLLSEILKDEVESKTTRLNLSHFHIPDEDVRLLIDFIGDAACQERLDSIYSNGSPISRTKLLRKQEK
jgi:hypothetical protein